MLTIRSFEYETYNISEQLSICLSLFGVFNKFLRSISLLAQLTERQEQLHSQWTLFPRLLTGLKLQSPWLAQKITPSWFCATKRMQFFRNVMQLEKDYSKISIQYFFLSFLMYESIDKIMMRNQYISF